MHHSPIQSAAPRLMCSLKAEFEWLYLVNETLIGEKCILPILQDLHSIPHLSQGLRDSLSKQISEEQQHVRMFESHVASEKLKGSDYGNKFRECLNQIPEITLKLFALQGILEGIALGALQYRIHNWEHSPSLATDTRALREEADHVGLSFPFFKELATLEGPMNHQQFRQTSRMVNKVFRDCFSPLALIRVAKQDFGENILESDINIIQLNLFKSLSTRTLLNTVNRFQNRYEIVLKGLSA